MRFDFMRLYLLAALLTVATDAGALAQSWSGTWAAAPSAAKGTEDFTSLTTLREIVHVSRGGESLRVTLTNELGTDTLKVSGVHVAVRSHESAIEPGSDTAVLFNGGAEIAIPPGAVAVSDAVPFHLAALSDLSISLLLPSQNVSILTVHALGLQTNYASDGDQLGAAQIEGAKTFDSWRLLKSVEVSAEDTPSSIVTLGDSITDGYRSTPDNNRRWPDVLATRLQADAKLRRIAVLNEGISGNRLLHDGAGPNALARLDRDVLSQSGVRFLILLEGINDIGGSAQPRTPGDAITAEQVIGAYSQIIDRAHAHGIKVYGATLTPYMGAGYSSPAGEVMRGTVNTWIRTSGRFDAVIDFDKITRDPAHPAVFAPAFDCGDHLHPSDAGYKAMGEAIDLKLFR